MCFDFYLLVWEYFVDLRELNLRFLDGEKILVLCILHPTQSTTGSTGIGLLCVGPLILLQVLDFCTRNHETGCTFDGYKSLFCDVTKSDRTHCRVVYFSITGHCSSLLQLRQNYLSEGTREQEWWELLQ